ncbi:MAG TPA: gamma-glutamylcyclotransferase, partial [Burkholderiaceae bacterium]
FVVRRDSSHFCARLGDAEVIEILAGARGHRGSNLDYLLRTTEALRGAGVPDPHLERLVRKARAALGTAVGATTNPSESGSQAGTEPDVHRPSAH